MPPKKLYKYRSLCGDNFKYTQAIILRNEIYFSSIKELNDPFEGRFKVIIPDILPETTICADAAILSLSQKRAEILMWSHYADDHKGICLEFDGHNSNSLFSRALPVIYGNTFNQITFDKDFDAENVTNMVCRAKSKHWKYEKEWRVIEGKKGLFKFPAEALTGVIAGCNISHENLSWVESWIRQRKTPTKFYRALQKKDSFSLKIIEVTLSPNS